MQFGQGEMTAREAFFSQHWFQQGAEIYCYLSTTCPSTDWQPEHQADVQCQNTVGDGEIYPDKKYSLEVHEW